MASTQSKERITTGAKELFSAPGYAATTVDAICEKSELTKGRFYCFFDSKEDLRLAKAHRDPTRIPRAIRGFRLSLATLIAIPESDGRTRLGKPMAVEIFKSTRTRILSVESGIQK